MMNFIVSEFRLFLDVTLEPEKRPKIEENGKEF